MSLYRQDGTLRYSGQMTGHRKEGWGTEYCPKGKSTYVGNWQQGKRHGHGTHTVFYPQSQRPCQRYTGLYLRNLITMFGNYSQKPHIKKIEGGPKGLLSEVVFLLEVFDV